MSADIIEFICRRRVTRHFLDTPVPTEHLWTILRAARWAPSASNVRLHSYVCLDDKQLIEQIRLVSPGIAGDTPAAIIALSVDRTLAAFDTVERSYYEYIDMGTATMNMLLAAEALGIGACPATLDSPHAVGALLNIPADWTIEMLVLLGYPRVARGGPAAYPRKKVRVEDLVQWGPFPPHPATGATATNRGQP